MLLPFFQSVKAGVDDVADPEDLARYVTSGTDIHTDQDNAPTYANCRFGLGLTGGQITDFAYMPKLNLGWYLNWGNTMTPVTLPGMEYAQMIRTDDARFPTPAELTDLVQANPGSIWLIGNEPDSIYMVQDNLRPEDYARRYHQAYIMIKSLDPSALVAVGGIVQPTPIRKQYLDLVLEAYQNQYGSTLQADAWHIHSFILREISAAYADETGLSYWGAEIPTGVDARYGELYLWPDDTDDLAIFEARLRDFRQWMASRGYRNLPLWITEYGTLADYYQGDPFVDSDGDPFDEVRARDFMWGTFDRMLSMEDGNTGYPADNDRLVQRWVWYSSADDDDFGGALFNSQTKEPYMLATAWHTYTAALSPSVDLLPVDLAQVHVPLTSQDPATATIRFRVSNAGNVALTETVSVRVWGDQEPLGEPLTITEALQGCATTIEFVVDWPDLSPGVHAFRVEVDPSNVIDERDETNNIEKISVLVASDRLFMPLILRQ
jgi:hypothetical protein